MVQPIRSLKFTAVPGVPLIRPGDPLAELIVTALGEGRFAIADGDVFVIAQKIVSKAEGREIALKNVAVSEAARALAADGRECSTAGR